jgi:hypothetical protein
MESCSASTIVSSLRTCRDTRGSPSIRPVKLSVTVAFTGITCPSPTRRYTKGSVTCYGTFSRDARPGGAAPRAVRNVSSSHDTRVRRNSTQCHGAANAAFCRSTDQVAVSLGDLRIAWGPGGRSNGDCRGSDGSQLNLTRDTCSGGIVTPPEVREGRSQLGPAKSSCVIPSESWLFANGPPGGGLCAHGLPS